MENEIIEFQDILNNKNLKSMQSYLIIPVINMVLSFLKNINKKYEFQKRSPNAYQHAQELMFLSRNADGKNNNE